MRKFDTGATRDTADGKPQYEGYLSPVVLHRYGQYMLEHQTQADGSTRSADNWQKGIPVDAYVDSLLRHVMDVWLHHRDRGDLATEEYEESLCAVLFNVQGLLYERLKESPYQMEAMMEDLDDVETDPVACPVCSLVEGQWFSYRGYPFRLMEKREDGVARAVNTTNGNHKYFDLMDTVFPMPL